MHRTRTKPTVRAAPVPPPWHAAPPPRPPCRAQTRVSASPAEPAFPVSAPLSSAPSASRAPPSPEGDAINASPDGATELLYKEWLTRERETFACTHTTRLRSTWSTWPTWSNPFCFDPEASTFLDVYLRRSQRCKEQPSTIGSGHGQAIHKVPCYGFAFHSLPTMTCSCIRRTARHRHHLPFAGQPRRARGL